MVPNRGKGAPMDLGQWFLYGKPTLEGERLADASTQTRQPQPRQPQPRPLAHLSLGPQFPLGLELAIGAPY